MNNQAQHPNGGDTPAQQLSHDLEGQLVELDMSLDSIITTFLNRSESSNELAVLWLINTLRNRINAAINRSPLSEDGDYGDH